MKKYSITRYIFIALLAIIALQCANPGTPTGGPRDRKPPVLVNSIPSANATGFSGDMVTLIFDENIQLKEQDKKFVVSPPMTIPPKLDAHGNTVRVRFDSDTVLMPGTTYTFDFADCLSDLNEGNIYENFTFTFSTGESQDTMMISGNVYDAETVSPVEGVYVLLQSNLADSAFRKVPPIRIAKTDAAGRFAIKNVPANRDYRIFALDDNNRNYIFDQPGEKIAWHGQTIRPSYEIRQIHDSVRVDSLSLSPDTADWVFQPILRDTLVYTPDSLVLYTFLEDHYDQYIVSDSRSKRNIIDIIFNKPMKNKPQFTFPGQNPHVEHATVEYSLGNDTCKIWLTDSLIYQGDSVMLAIQYPVLDSLDNLVSKSDTLDLWYVNRASAEKKERGRRRRSEKAEKPKIEMLKYALSQNIGVYSHITLEAETPIRTIDWQGIRLMHKVDTVFEPLTYTTLRDTVNLKRYTIKADWVAGDEYRVEIDSACIFDIYGLHNDKKESKVSVTPLEKYGTMYVVLDSVPDNALLQLVVSNKVVRQTYVPASGKVGFRYLKPGTYMVRMVIDVNRNGQWDTGNYADGLQPELINYYMEKVNVRANWDIKVEYSVSNYSPSKFYWKFNNKSKNKTNSHTSRR